MRISKFTIQVFQVEYLGTKSKLFAKYFEHPQRRVIFEFLAFKLVFCSVCTLLGEDSLDILCQKGIRLYLLTHFFYNPAHLLLLASLIWF